MVSVAANPGGQDVLKTAAGGRTGSAAAEDVAATGGGGGDAKTGGTASTAVSGVRPPQVTELLEALTAGLRVPTRSGSTDPARFYFAVDHCFMIKGQGTVLTGTVLNGSISVNDVRSDLVLVF